MGLKTKAILVTLASCLFCVGVANGASFDCKKARTFSEKAICKNPQLSQLDDNLDIAFKNARQSTGNSDEFKAIAKGNLALRNECKTDACLEKWFNNSITLYEFISSLAPAPSDPLAAYPQEVKDACTNNVSDSDMGNCIRAQDEYDQKQMEENYEEALAANGLTMPEKDALKVFYEQWKKDRDRYCDLLENGGTISYIKIASCRHSWTQDLAEEMEEFVGQLDSESDWQTGLRKYIAEIAGVKKETP
ncbi:MAG: hypothetical protein LUC43_09690 [Burkholderiales bacterium]|nr:hypothetical protein [Burkholderiales bacterium]